MEAEWVKGGGRTVALTTATEEGRPERGRLDLYGGPTRAAQRDGARMASRP
jgi:hypothetical protein